MSGKAKDNMNATLSSSATFHVAAAVRPEKALMIAVLDDAIRILRKYGRMAGKYGRMPARGHLRAVAEAEQWLFSDDTEWPFSLVNVCAALDIDAGWLRAQLGPRMLAEAPATVTRPIGAPREGRGRSVGMEDEVRRLRTTRAAAGRVAPRRQGTVLRGHTDPHEHGDSRCARRRVVARIRRSSGSAP
jgi:hypothetical protein